MATKVFVNGGTSSSSPEVFTVASNSTQVFGASSGYQKVVIQSGVTGATLDANIEEITLNDNLSTYTFQAVAGTGFQIKSGTTVVATLANINQSVKINFAGSDSATLRQTGGATFNLNGVGVANATTISATDLGATTSLTAAQATTNLNNGLHYSPTQDITINGTGTELATLAPNAHNLGGKSITLNASNNAVSLSLAQASDTVVFGGVKFAGTASGAGEADTVFVGLTDGTNNNVPISLAAALVDLGVSGTQITLDQNISMTIYESVALNVNGLGKWSFNNSTDDLTYWNGSAAKTITLAGINTVTVAASGDMTMTLG